MDDERGAGRRPAGPGAGSRATRRPRRSRRPRSTALSALAPGLLATGLLCGSLTAGCGNAADTGAADVVRAGDRFGATGATSSTVAPATTRSTDGAVTAAAPSTPAPTTAPSTTAGPTSPTGAPITSAATAATTTPTIAAPSPPSTAPPPTTAPPATTAPVEPPTVRIGPDGFRFEVRGIDAALRARMEPTSWRPGCPVDLADLRYLRLGHRDFGGAERTGELVVHRDAVDAMFDAFAALWVARYPIRSMRLVDDFGGSDDASIEADNTSAFNCRFVAGTTRWSNHATGRAIDINPIENPWVAGGVTDHPASVPFLDRRPAPGVIIEGDAVTRAFDAVGWGWGGRWGEPLDYQHFSASGN